MPIGNLMIISVWWNESFRQMGPGRRKSTLDQVFGLLLCAWVIKGLKEEREMVFCRNGQIFNLGGDSSLFSFHQYYIFENQLNQTQIAAQPAVLNKLKGLQMGNISDNVLFRYSLVKNMFKITKNIFNSFSSVSQVLQTAKRHQFKLGQYPKALDYSRPFNLTKLPNGIRVASEIMYSNIASISVFIKCGSRNQTPQSSGTAHFLQHLHFKGTKNRTKQQLQKGVQSIGGNLNAYTSRQNTSYMMTVFKDDIDKAVQIVGDMITNSLYRPDDVKRERSTIKRELIQTQKSNPMQTTIQISHRGIYKDHVMALPILGSIINMQTISKQMIQEYHNQNYVGQNIILVACGPINHDQLIQSVNKHIKVPEKAKRKPPALKKPKFEPGISSLQSDLTQKVNMTVSYEAPSFFDHEFFTYLLLQRILSDRPEFQLELQILSNLPQFKFQKHLAPYDFIFKQKGFYSSYWDTGIFGNYFLCEPSKVSDVISLSVEGFSKYAKGVTQQQIERAKRKVFVQILHHENQNDITQSIANNIMYYDRRVTNKQVAERVAVVGAKQIQNLCQRLLDTSKINVCLWGNVQKVPFLKKK